jgi:hypothetical protein
MNGSLVFFMQPCTGVALDGWMEMLTVVVVAAVVRESEAGTRTWAMNAAEKAG